MPHVTTNQASKLTISELMRRERVTVPIHTTLHSVARLLAEGKTRHVLVTDAKGTLVGVVSEHEVLRQLVMNETGTIASMDDKTVESVMVTQFISTSPQADLEDMASVLAEGSVRCLPIVEADDLVGLMTPEDLLFSWNRLRGILQQVGTDSSTGLLNRFAFERRLSEELERARRQRLPLSVVLCDVDNFQQINDLCGRHTGDAVLRLVGNCMGRHLRAYDVLARLGGDEFAAICTGCGPEETETLARRVQNAVRGMNLMLKQERHEITVSIGGSVIQGHSGSVRAIEFIHAAEECLFQAKFDGPDSFRIAEFVHGESPSRPRSVSAQQPADLNRIAPSVVA